MSPRRAAADRGRGGRRRPDASGPAAIGGRRAVLEAVRAGAATRVFLGEGARGGSLRELLDACGRAGVPVETVDRARLDALVPDHRGVVARVRIPPPVGEQELSRRAFADDALVVVLDGIEDPQNLGAAARTAEVAGASLLVTRRARSADVTASAVRASAGALLHLPHARVPNLARALDRLRDAGFTIIGLDEDAPVSVYDARAEGRIALVVGAEGEGMSRLVRERCDELVSLPRRGKVGSLNASAALAAVLYAFALRPVPGAEMARPAGAAGAPVGRPGPSISS
ncbi:MAG: 23S rRNA (guanosine(2251)-2'-O)-methyltransferase RlmB [Actinomycetota bacterium]